MSMTGLERMTRNLQRKPADRIGLYEHFWGDTHKKWCTEGHIKADEDLSKHFDYDLVTMWAFNYVADLDFKPEVIEETADTILRRDGNGALLRSHKKHDSTPEHVDFAVKTRADWDRLIKPKIAGAFDPRRLNLEGYRTARDAARAGNRFFAWSGINVFEQMHPICGHENMLMGMAEDPDWIKDMVDTLSEMNLKGQKMLFEMEGYPDGIWYYEDMGFLQRPFMSLDMYCDIIQPGHIKTIQYAKSHGLPVIMHSCGFVEPLLPGMVEAGIDCLQVIEVKAGMDLLRIFKNWGDRLSLMGGIDVRVLYSNDRAKIDAELQAKLPLVKQGFGYTLHSDHSIPHTVEYDTYRYFVDRALELGRY